MMANVNDLLRSTKNILLDPRNWTKGSFAKDRNGFECQPARREAVCWCLYGALIKASWDAKQPYLYEDAVKFLRDKIPGNNLVGWNDRDSTTHDDVVDLLDTLIEEKTNAR